MFGDRAREHLQQPCAALARLGVPRPRHDKMDAAPSTAMSGWPRWHGHGIGQPSDGHGLLEHLRTGFLSIYDKDELVSLGAAFSSLATVTGYTSYQLRGGFPCDYITLAAAPSVTCQAYFASSLLVSLASRKSLTVTINAKTTRAGTIVGTVIFLGTSGMDATEARRLASSITSSPLTVNANQL